MKSRQQSSPSWSETAGPQQDEHTHEGTASPESLSPDLPGFSTGRKVVRPCSGVLPSASCLLSTATALPSYRDKGKVIICKEMLPRGKDSCDPLWTVNHRKHMWPCLMRPGRDDQKLPGTITAYGQQSLLLPKGEMQLGRNLTQTGRSLN